MVPEPSSGLVLFHGTKAFRAFSRKASTSRASRKRRCTTDAQAEITTNDTTTEKTKGAAAQKGHARTMALRYAWFIVGVLVNSFGIALITKAALGTSPISSVAYVLSLALPLTIGQFTFIMNMVFIALQPVLLRREYRPIQVLQIAVNVVFSAFLDVSMGMLSWLDPATLPLQLAALLAGCVILGVGVAVEVAPDVLTVPGEGLVRAIYIVVSRRFGSARFGTIKNLFDISLMLIAVALSLALFGYLNGIGVGTVIAALLVGRIVNLANDHLPLIPYIKKLR